MSHEEKHSEHYFTDERDFWWNEDFLELMAKRWELSNVHNVLDIGCGVGHWTSALLRILPKNVAFCAIDREPEWVKQYSKRFKDRVTVQQSSAERLPFVDNSFDFVTCQTLLIHISNPKNVIKEMLRVLKPGGLLAVAEPSNLAQGQTSVETGVEDAMALYHLNLVCQRGKIALGEGDNSLGDLLPGYFSEMGLINIQVFASDRAGAAFPPYDHPGQKAFLADIINDADKQFFMFGYEQTRKYYLAGSGKSEKFDELWSIGVKHLEKTKAAIINQTYHEAGCGVMYLVSGRKPR